MAGVLSALLLGTAMALILNAIPADSTDATVWLTDPSHRDVLNVALALVPFAGILFLWFMGAVRDYFGKAEDKFFATLFLGGGLLFVAMLFVLSAATYGLLASADTSQGSAQLQLWQYVRQFDTALLSTYCTRMAAVLTLAATTIGHGLDTFPRWLIWLGYLVAVVLLFIDIPWSELIFPVWILLLSSFVFLADRHHRGADTPTS
ncbi:hypothetical protein ACFY71_11100 [Streptomyces cinerochromogenes]|uniref:hypothetical protein n=1 Tax=Streptomyces cinerochromogenes TaxID=66422 RepID=UPI00368F0A0D